MDRNQAIVNQLLGVRRVMSDESVAFAEQCQTLLNDQLEAIEAGDYERANALGSVVQNMSLLMIVDVLVHRP